MCVFLLLSRWMDHYIISCVCERKRNRDPRTGCHCAAKPPGCAGKPGQEQQLTHTQLTKNDTHCLSLIRRSSRGARFHTDILFTCGPTSAATVCPPTLTLCAVWAVARGASLKPHVILAFRLLISCDRCIPPGGVEFELFIKPHESIKSHGAVGHKHMHALYPYVESRQERSQRQ